MNPLIMFLDGWCDDCDQDVSECLLKAKCIGEKEDESNEDESTFVRCSKKLYVNNKEK